MSSFRIGGTTANFFVVSNLDDSLQAQEVYTIGIQCPTPTDWGALASLRSSMLNSREIPGGTTTVNDIGWGAGEGTLVLDNFGEYTAVLTNLKRTDVDSGVTNSVGSATFTITST